MVILDEAVSIFDIKVLYYILIVLLFVGTICLLNYVINPMIQGRMCIKELYKRTDVEGAYKDAPIGTSWYSNILKMRENLKELESIKCEEVTINSFDNLKLVGYLYKKTKAKGTVILVHGCHSYALREFACLTNYYYKKGYNVLIIDQRGHNKSEGEVISFGVNEHKDLLDWIDFVDEYFKHKYKIYLHGISLGACVVMMCADKVNNSLVKGIIVDSGFIGGEELISKSLVGSINNPKKLEKSLYYADKYSKKHYGFSIKEINPEECIKNTDVPMLFIIGSADTNGTHETDTLYRDCSSTYKDMLVVNGATHGESFYRDEKEYIKRVEDLMEEKYE
ncbi:MAG: alpha/beta hydrolase [Bacilli bacterium]